MAMASVAGIFGLIIYLFVLMLPIALLVALQVWLCRPAPTKAAGFICTSLSKLSCWMISPVISSRTVRACSPPVPQRPLQGARALTGKNTASLPPSPPGPG